MSDATEAAEMGTEAWKGAVRLQRAAVPDHDDFYSLCRELVATLWALGRLTAVLSDQVADYGGDRRVLRDDEGLGPGKRLTIAATLLGGATTRISQAERAVNLAWSAIGHIGLAEPATVEVETGEG